MTQQVKISEKQVLKAQRFVTRFNELRFIEIVLDPGCSQFGQLPYKAFHKTVRVMFDFSKNAWVSAEI